MTDEIANLKRKLDIEKAARKHAEQTLELKSRELHTRNIELEGIHASLEKEVEKRTRDLEQARDEALAAAKAKSQFMANMSHEIRTPLNGVLGILSMLSDGNSGRDPKELLDTATRSGQMLLDIVNDILDFSKLDAGQIQLHEEPCKLRALIADTLEPMRHLAQERGITLESSYPDEAPKYVLADALRLRQIITNLISNALKFTIEGQVSCDVIFLGSEFQIVVSDTGIGMSQEQLERIFKAFGQADGSITREFGGTGLGLTITESFVGMMGGRIDVDSTPGEGSCFRVTLPLKEAEIGNDERLDVDQEITRDTRFNDALVLLVEDNDVNQMIAQHLLHHAGLRVDTCQNGEEALTFIQLKQYDLVLMDIQMPVMDGLEATRVIRSYGAEYASLPIIAMTAHATQEHRAESLEAGMNDHITKPIDPIQLYRVMSNYLPLAKQGSEWEQIEQEDEDTFDIEFDDEPQMKPLPVQVPGLDIAEAMERLGHNQKLYLKLLSSFAARQSNLINHVSRALDDGQFEEARVALHTAKGSSANISAVRFSEVAARYESAVIQEHESKFQPLTVELSEAWSELEASIYALIGEFVLERPAQASMSDEDAIAHLRTIDQYLHQDISKVEELMELFRMRGYDGTYQKTISDLSASLEIFDIPSAERHLAMLFEEFDS